ncbi:MAG: LytR C-terminal domain-containing protein [Mycobacteriales bacterium]
MTSGQPSGQRVRQVSRRGRDRARLRALALFVILLLLTALAVWLVVRTEATGAKTAASPCAVKSGQPGAVKLRVLNATAREGLAALVAAQLRNRGYTVTAVGNDSKGVAGPAEVRHGAKGLASARLLAATIRGATLRTDARTGTDVDLVLGNQFRTLLPVKPAPTQSACVSTAKTTGSPRPA